MSPLTVKQLLEQTRAKIEDPAHWVKGDYAKNAEGSVVTPYDSDACCWCLDGALRAVAIPQPRYPLVATDLLLRQASQARGFASHLCFNDAPQTTHADVLQLLDDAILVASTGP